MRRIKEKFLTENEMLDKWGFQWYAEKMYPDINKHTQGINSAMGYDMLGAMSAVLMILSDVNLHNVKSEVEDLFDKLYKEGKI